MSGRRVQHLVERGRGFQVRLPVPIDLQERLGRKELRWSVQTRDPSIAKDRVLKATLAFRQLCDKLRCMRALTAENARDIARIFYRKLAESYVTPEPAHPADQDYFENEQAKIVDDLVRDLAAQVGTQDYTGEVVEKATLAAANNGFDFPEKDTEAFRALCQGIARAQIEFARFTLFRQSDLLAEYKPQDELFDTAQVSAPKAGLQSIANDQVSLSLGEAVAKYVDAHSSGPGAWNLKTAEEKERTYKIVQAVWGPDLSIRQIKTEHVRDMRDFIQAIRSKAKLDEEQPQNMLAKAVSDRLNPKTASKYFGYVRSLLRWLVAEGYLDTEPGHTIKLHVPKAGNKSRRRPFLPAELDKLFSSPLYAGFKSNTQRHIPGELKRQDGLYWVYLLALHTGMRAGELLQIAKGDIRLDVTVPYIDLRSDLDLKTESSVRQVPVHPALLSYGLAGWLDARPAQSDERLFCEIKLGAAGHRTSAASKKFIGYLKRAGVKTDEEIVFHSFRHTFVDAARSSEVPEARMKEIIGHKDTTVTGGYGQGANLKALAVQMEKIDFGLSPAVQDLLMANART